MILSADFESRSTVPLPRTGVYPYAEHPTTDLWMLGWAIDDGEVQLWHPGEPIPEEIADQIQDFDQIRAWNANFERVMWWLILSPRYGFPRPELEQFVDTAAEAAAMALPRHLAQAAKALGMEHQKDAEGRRLMLQMSKPRKPRKGEDPDQLYWWDTPEKIQRLGEYCKQDVRVERAIAQRLRPLSKQERRVYLLDQKMNDRGVPLDRDLILAAQDIVDEGIERANVELQQITDGAVSAVTNTNELRDFLDLDSVAKDVVRDVLDEGELTDVDRRVLEIRQDAGKSSTSKLVSLQEYAASDWRARGMLLYHGASTGRWSGKGPQPHNFPRPELKQEELETMIPLVLARDYDAIAEHHPPVVVISSLLRSMIKARAGYRLVGGDFSQVEARVLAWIAEATELEELFRQDGKVYEEMAGTIFGRPVETIAKDSDERQVGKNTVLGCGFQMGAVTFWEQVKTQTGLDLSEDHELALTKHGWECSKCEKSWQEKPDTRCLALPLRAVDSYRTRFYQIPMFWDNVNQAAMEAVANPGDVIRVGRAGKIRFVVRDQFLWCVLPNGRPLAYALPKLVRHTVTPRVQPGEEHDTFTTTAVRFMGVGQNRKWKRLHAYGGKWTENIVQAMARDLIAGALLRLEDAGYRPILSVHDEVLSEPRLGHGSLDDYLNLMRKLPRWAEGLPVDAEGWEGERYRK